MNNHQYKLEEFYTSLEEPLRGTLLFLRETILQQDTRMKESWKYSMPFFTMGKKMFCYFWFDKGNRSKPYLSFADGYRMEHPMLEQDDRKRMKIVRFKPEDDLPVEDIVQIIKLALRFYQQPKS